MYLLLAAAALGASVDVKARDIHPADVLQWSWRQFVLQGLVALAGVEFITIIVIVAVLMGAGPTTGLKAVLFGHGQLAVGAAVGAVLTAGALLARRAPLRWVLTGLVAGAVLATELLALKIPEAREVSAGVLSFSAIIGVIVGGIGAFETSVIQSRSARRSGAWFWLRVPLLAAVCVGGVIATGVMAMGFAADEGSWTPRYFGFAVAIGAVLGGPFALIAFFRFGGFNGVQHLVLRFLLERSGRWPRKAVEFLERAAQVALLQKVGFGYRFIHALLLDHFADRDRKSGGESR
jgi:hypothetical protein